MALSSVVLTSIFSSSASASYNILQGEGQGYIEIAEWHQTYGRYNERSPEYGAFPCRVLRNSSGDIRVSYKIDGLWTAMEDLDYPLRQNNPYRGIPVLPSKIKGFELCKNRGSVQDITKTFYTTDDVNVTIYNFKLNYQCQSQPKLRSGSELIAVCDTRL